MTVNMDWFQDDGIFMPMLNDTGRNTFYKSAIEQKVSGRTVVDIGAGSGLLSILAARAGATHVWAVEQDQQRAELAHDLVTRAGLGSVIEVVHADFLTTSLAADFYVSETINTQIFGENILELSQHARKLGGEFIPGSFEIWAEVYQPHPIFALCQTRSDAYQFEPEIEIEPEFERLLNREFVKQNSRQNTLYRANILAGLFKELPNFTDLKLTQLYRGTSIVVDLNKDIVMNQLSITLAPNQVWQQSGVDAYVVLFWRAVSGTAVMHCTDSWFGNVAKTLKIEQRTPDTPVELWYDPVMRDWRISY